MKMKMYMFRLLAAPILAADHNAGLTVYSLMSIEKQQAGPICNPNVQFDNAAGESSSFVQGCRSTTLLLQACSQCSHTKVENRCTHCVFERYSDNTWHE